MTDGIHNTTGGADIQAFGNAPTPLVEAIMTAAAYASMTGFGSQHTDFTVNSHLSARTVVFVAKEAASLFNCDTVSHDGLWTLTTDADGAQYTLTLRWNGIRFIAERLRVVAHDIGPDIPNFMTGHPVELD